MRTVVLAAAMTVLMSSMAAVKADPPPWAPAHGWRARHHGDDGEYDHRRRDEGPAFGLTATIYRGRDGRYYCRRSNGTTGLVVGAAVGGLIGNRLAPGHSAVLGTLLGAGAGAILGQAIDRGALRCE